MAPWPLLAATAFVSAGAESASSGAPKVTVIVPHLAPRAVDLRSLTRSVAIYLQEFEHEVVEVEDLPASAEAQLAQAGAIAAQRGARFAVWYDWQGAALVVRVAEVGLPEPTTTSFSVDYPKVPAANFYRQLGLKLRGVLKAAALIRAAGREPAEAGPEKAPPVSPSPKEEPTRQPPSQIGAAAPLPPSPTPSRPEHVGPVAELGAGAQLTAGAGAVASFSAQVLWEKGPWAAGAGVALASTEVRRSAAATGEASTARLSIAVQRRLLGDPEATISFRLGLTAGVLFVGTSATPQDEEEPRQSTDAVFVLGLEAWTGHRLADWLEVIGGPTADFFPQRYRLLARGAEVYDTGWAQVGLQARLRGSF
ncbi:MAG: hypothetical protein HYZ28_19140 [Myxococcales bacterium]|nr:hypothetical protein [Myxococcales bacterium]